MENNIQNHNNENHYDLNEIKRLFIFKIKKLKPKSILNMEVKKKKSTKLASLFDSCNVRYLSIDYENLIFGYKIKVNDSNYKEEYNLMFIKSYNTEISQKDYDKIGNFGINIVTKFRIFTFFLNSKNDFLLLIKNLNLILNDYNPKIIENHFLTALKLFEEPYLKELEEKRKEAERKLKEEELRKKNEELKRQRELKEKEKRLKEEIKRKEEEEEKRKKDLLDREKQYQLMMKERKNRNYSNLAQKSKNLKGNIYEEVEYMFGNFYEKISYSEIEGFKESDILNPKSKYHKENLRHKNDSSLNNSLIKVDIKDFTSKTINDEINNHQILEHKVIKTKSKIELLEELSTDKSFSKIEINDKVSCYSKPTIKLSKSYKTGKLNNKNRNLNYKTEKEELKEEIHQDKIKNDMSSDVKSCIELNDKNNSTTNLKIKHNYFSSNLNFNFENISEIPYSVTINNDNDDTNSIICTQEAYNKVKLNKKFTNSKLSKSLISKESNNNYAKSKIPKFIYENVSINKHPIKTISSKMMEPLEVEKINIENIMNLKSFDSYVHSNTNNKSIKENPKLDKRVDIKSKSINYNKNLDNSDLEMFDKEIEENVNINIPLSISENYKNVIKDDKRITKQINTHKTNLIQHDVKDNLNKIFESGSNNNTSDKNKSWVLNHVQPISTKSKISLDNSYKNYIIPEKIMKVDFEVEGLNQEIKTKTDLKEIKEFKDKDKIFKEYLSEYEKEKLKDTLTHINIIKNKVI